MNRKIQIGVSASRDLVSITISTEDPTDKLTDQAIAGILYSLAKSISDNEEDNAKNPVPEEPTNPCGAV